VEVGRAFVHLGTSAQLFVATARYRPHPQRFLHAFCHALPGRWYQMAAMLNGASVIGNVARWLGTEDVAALISEAEAEFRGPAPLLMLPYLAGERTPHDDPLARGVVFGLTGGTSRAHLVQAALEGVAFSFADALDVVAATGTELKEAGFIGGGARSSFWGRILANVMNLPLMLYRSGETGPAFGAARLARIGVTHEPVASVVREPEVVAEISPEATLVDAYRGRIEAFRQLYATLRPEFANLDEAARPSS
jgi:xylulokinase